MTKIVKIEYCLNCTMIRFVKVGGVGEETSGFCSHPNVLKVVKNILHQIDPNCPLEDYLEKEECNLFLVKDRGCPKVAYPRKLQAKIYSSGFSEKAKIEIIEGIFIPKKESHEGPGEEDGPWAEGWEERGGKP